MDDLIQIRTRTKSPDESPEDVGKPRLRAPRLSFAASLRDAAHVATSILPSRDSSKNGREKMALYLGLGYPLSIAIVSVVYWQLASVKIASSLAYDTGPFVSLCVAAGVTALAFVIPWLATFALALAFSLGARGSRARVQQALVCPYCRDQVAQDGTVICARSGCAALYHRECWDECAVQYGGCAIYGCSSKKSREISAAGYILRISRLAVAALVFTPRMARAIRDHGGDELAPVLRRSFDGAKVWHREANQSRRQWQITLGGAVVLLVALCAFGESWMRSVELTDTQLVTLVYGLFLSVPFALLGLPFVVALLTLPVYFSVQALATVFKNELAALGRADEGGGSVLGRLRSGIGGKKECC